MANGYGGSSSSSSSSRLSNITQAPGTQLQANTQRLAQSPSSEQYPSDSAGILVKVLNGVEAPAGFHYMPNGKLMSDADHIAMNGYISKNISGLTFEDRDILNQGETRSFVVNGDAEAIFSFEIFSSNNEWYNFDTKTWSASKYMLRRKKVGTIYEIKVVFVALPDTDLVTYTMNLHAETAINVKTYHAPYSPFVNKLKGIDVVNVNKSKGSNSSVLTKIIYQDALKTLKLSAIAPSLYLASTNTVAAGATGNRITIDNGDGSSNVATNPKNVQIGDKVTETGIAASLHALVTKIDPDNDNPNEIEISISDTVTNNQTITFTPPFNGMTPHDTQSSDGANTSSISSGETVDIRFEVTFTAPAGRTFNILRTPTTNDLCVHSPITFGGAALPIEGEDTDSAAKFFRWPITTVVGNGGFISTGMRLDPGRSGTGVNTTTPAIISDYIATATQQVFQKGDYDNFISTTTIDDIVVDGVSTSGYDITSIDRNGNVKVQAGDIVFNTQQLDALKSDSAVKIFAYGQKDIETLTRVKIELSGVEMRYSGFKDFDKSTGADIPLTKAVTSGAVSSSTTIGLTSVSLVSPGMIVSGPNINPAVANPTVVSKSVATGAGNIVVSSAQTLESGQGLDFTGGTGTLIMRGVLKVSNMYIYDLNVFFDVEKFLKCN
tara:strand:+ start:1256 stop:3247 length:1992 start_codon:yes stop_codon:yes gene_type:complete